MKNEKEDEAYKGLRRIVREEMREAGFDVSLADMNFSDEDYKDTQKLIDTISVNKHYKILDKLYDEGATTEESSVVQKDHKNTKEKR